MTLRHAPPFDLQPDETNTTYGLATAPSSEPEKLRFAFSWKDRSGGPYTRVTDVHPTY